MSMGKTVLIEAKRMEIQWESKLDESSSSQYIDFYLGIHIQSESYHQAKRMTRILELN